MQLLTTKIRHSLKQKVTEVVAVYYAKKGRFNRAVKLFEASEINKRASIYGLNSHYLYALSLFRINKNLIQAKQLIESVIDSSREFNAEGSVLLAEIYLKMDAPKDSEQVLVELRKRQHNSYKIRYLLGLAYHNQGKWVFAKEELESIKEKGASDPVLLRSLALSQFCTTQYKDAAINYRDAAKIFESKGMRKQAVYCAYRSAWSAEAARDEGDSVKGVDIELMYETAMQNDTVHDSSQYGLGILHEFYGRRNEAIRAYSESIEAGSHITHLVLLKRASILSDTGDYEGAEKDISESISIKPTMEAFEMQGVLRFKNKDYLGAEESFISAISRSNSPKRDLIDWYLRSLTKNGRNDELEGVQELLSSICYEYRYRSELSAAQYYELFSKHRLIDENTIVYESFQGKNFGENLSVLCRYISKSPQYHNYKHVVVLNDEDKAPTDLIKNPNIIIVQRNSILYAYYLSTAKYLINNTTFPDYFIRREGQKYLNTWHGVAWKTLGRDMRAGLSEMSNSQRNLLQSSHLITPNHHMENVLLDRYCIRDIYTGKVAHIGYPRIDETIASTNRDRESLKRELGFSLNEKIILYAPTWRGSNADVKLLSQDVIVEDIESIEKLTKARVVYRGHHIDSAGQGVGKMSRYEVPENISSNALLSIADLLITDYSSIAFDMVAARKPVVWYLPDYDEYSNERGLYFSRDELPGPVALKREELAQAVKGGLDSYDSDKSTDFINTYCPYDDGKSTERVVKFFLEDDDEHVVEHRDKSKRNVLMYAGNFLVNGITTSSINLINSIDGNKYNVFLICNMQAIEPHPERMAQMDKLDKSINIIARTPGIVGMLHDEKTVIKRKQDLFELTPNEIKVYEQSYQREYRRVMSDALVDSIVNIDGYLEYEAALLGINKGSKAKIQNSIYLHNDIYSEYKNKFRFLARVFGLYPYYDNLASVSKGTSDLNRDNLAERFNIEKNKFIYINNVHNVESLLERANEPLSSEDSAIFCGDSKVFLTIGRLSPEKDHEKLIRAFSKLEPREAKLIIIGYGALETRLRSLVKDLGCSNIYILGLRSNPMPLLKRADCFVLSSNYEGQPVVLFEAMILKKPIIATDIVANRGALDNGRYGTLCNNDVDSLSAAMQGFLDNPDNFRGENFDIDNYNKLAMSRFYEEILRV